MRVGGPESERSRAVEDFALSYRRLQETGKIPPRWVARPTYDEPVFGPNNKPIVDITLAPLPGPKPSAEHGPNVYDSLEEFLGHEPRDLVKNRKAQKQGQTQHRGLLENMKLAGAALLGSLR